MRRQTRSDVTRVARKIVRKPDSQEEKMDRASALAKMTEYRDFVDNVLRPQLLHAKSLKQKVLQEIEEYKELSETLQKRRRSLQPPPTRTPSSTPVGDADTKGEERNDTTIIRSSSSKPSALLPLDQQQQDQEQQEQDHDHDRQRVDLGFGKVFCEARIDWQAPLFIHVGMGFHVEMTIAEGLSFIQQRLRYLQEQVLPHRLQKIRQIEKHVASSEYILNELARNLTTAMVL